MCHCNDMTWLFQLAKSGHAQWILQTAAKSASVQSYCRNSQFTYRQRVHELFSHSKHCLGEDGIFLILQVNRFTGLEIKTIFPW